MISSLRGIVLLGAVLVLVVAVALWKSGGARPAEPPGTTTGVIIVSSPEVYSRERLVNDRFQEATWLDSELRKIDKLYWGATVSKSQKIQNVTGLQVGANQSADNLKLPNVTPGPQPDGTDKSSSRAQTSQQPSVDGLAQSSPIERFRDRVAYREEVRAASLETQLDDRHDIRGNTLYRVKFSVTIVPEHDTSAWALVYVELRGADNTSGAENDASAETYHDWLKYYEDQLNDEVDRLSDRSTNDWEPDEFTKFSGYVVTALQDRACRDKADTDCKGRLTARTASTQAKMEDLKRDYFAVHHPDCNPRTWTAKGQKTCDRLPELQAGCDSSLSPLEFCPWQFGNHERLEALLQDYRAVFYQDIPEESWPRPRPFFRQVIANYLLWRLNEHHLDLWSAQVVECEIGMCRIKLDQLEGGAVKFTAALSADQVFAYAVSPKESVQRIADLASSQRERQLALGMSLQSQRVPLNLVTTLLQQSEKDDSLLQAVRRKPLVVGFAPPGAASPEPHSASEAAKGAAKDDVANFGWIIGPRFDIGDAGTARFRHSASENDVSAIISVPSWWKSAVVTVTTCWVDERQVRKIPPEGLGVDRYAECKDKHEEGHLIQLPSHLDEIARKLGLDAVRRPSVLPRPVLTKDILVEAGERADILIEGNHLWRSTVVTLNGKPADNITVLPDMKGIVARFNQIARPPPGQVQQELKVFTSEGSVRAGWVNVLQRSTPAPASTPTVAPTAAKKS